MVDMIILDRDGVINEDSDHYIKSVEEWIPIKGSLEAIARLKKAGYLVTVATNQSGLARGFFDEKTLQAMHDKMARMLADRGVAIDGIFYCPHGPNEGCACRKPRPGLLLQIAKAFDVNLKNTLFVGDSMSDLQAAGLVGAKSVLLKTGKGLRTLEKMDKITDLPIYDDLAHFVREFLKQTKTTG